MSLMNRKLITRNQTTSLCLGSPIKVEKQSSAVATPKHSQTSTWTGMGMLVKELHPLKAQFPMAMTDSGIVMLSKDLQL